MKLGLTANNCNQAAESHTSQCYKIQTILLASSEGDSHFLFFWVFGQELKKKSAAREYPQTFSNKEREQDNQHENLHLYRFNNTIIELAAIPPIIF